MIENWDDSGGREEERVALRSLLKMLGEVERFYDCIGGIISYEMKVFELLAESSHESETVNLSQQPCKLLNSSLVEIHPPSVANLSKDTEYAFQAALWGIEGLPNLGEIYPLGGSADRLDLVHPKIGVPSRCDASFPWSNTIGMSFKRPSESSYTSSCTVNNAPHLLRLGPALQRVTMHILLGFVRDPDGLGEEYLVSSFLNSLLFQLWLQKMDSGL